MKKNKTTKLAVPVKRTAPVHVLVSKPAYNTQVDKKKVLNNGQFHKFTIRRKKHSIKTLAQKNRQTAVGHTFYREAGRKVKQTSAPLAVQRFTEGLSPSGTGILETSNLHNKGVTGSLASYKQYFAKKQWYYDKRAPIPGGNAKLSTGFMRKNKFYKKIFASYGLFKKYQGFNKKAMNKQHRNMASHMNTNSFQVVNDWGCNRALMHMDSLFKSTMRKSGVMLNLYHNKIRQSYTLNGKVVRKKNFVQKHGNKAFQKDRDFCILMKKNNCKLNFILFVALETPFGKR